MSQLSRPPLSENQMAIIESRFYSGWQPPGRSEGVELDVAMERMRLIESNSQWLSRQARGLHREFEKKRLPE